MSVLQRQELGDIIKALEEIQNNIRIDKSIQNESIRQENSMIVNRLLTKVNDKVTAKNTSAQGLQRMWVKAIATMTLPSRDTILLRLDNIYKNYRMVSQEEDARQTKREQDEAAAANLTFDMKGQLGAPIQNTETSNSSTSSLPSASRFPVNGTMPSIGQTISYLNVPGSGGYYNSRRQPPPNTGNYSTRNHPCLPRPLCPPEQAQRFRNQGPLNKPRDTILVSTHRSSSSLPTRASDLGTLSGSVQQVPQVLDKGKGKVVANTHKRSDSAYTFGGNRPTPGTGYRKSWSSHESKNSGTTTITHGSTEGNHGAD